MSRAVGLLRALQRLPGKPEVQDQGVEPKVLASFAKQQGLRQQAGTPSPYHQLERSAAKVMHQLPLLDSITEAMHADWGPHISPCAGASYGEASNAMRAALSSGSLGEASKDVLPGQGSHKQSFNTQLRLGTSPCSFASQLHTLSKKEEQSSSPLPQIPAGTTLPQAAQALSMLPPKPHGPTLPSRRHMAGTTVSGGGEGYAPGHLETGVAHPFHVVPPSPWPFTSCMSVMTMLMGMAGWFHQVPTCNYVMFGGVASLGLSMMAWWRDCIIEGDMGMHTEAQKKNLMNGVWLFIASEAWLFFGLLWSCVHLGMSPSVWLQMQWPPVGVEAIGWEGRALVMSAVLAASYYSANVAMVAKDPKVVKGALATTIGLGFLFLADQYLEYSTAPFTITDSPYGCTFFVTTGFHGFHVLVGSIWLLTAYLNYSRVLKPTVTLKSAVLYWHFVDIVWIGVYGIIYAAQL